MQSIDLVKAGLYTYSPPAYMEITMLKRTTAAYFAHGLAMSMLAVFILATGFHSPAHAQDTSDDLGDESEGAVAEPMAEEAPVDPNAIRHGIGLRARYIFVPQSLIEVFVEAAPSGVSQTGFGLDYVRRKKEFEFSVGFEYDALSPSNGFFVERGGDPVTMPGTTDEIRFDNLSWFTIDAAFVYHHKLSDLVSLRYGGGIGIGIVSGEIIQTDAMCSGPNPQSDCSRVPTAIPGGEFDTKQDFFRFPPVFSALGGVQITPGHNVAINVELGMRTVFYTGIGVQYFL